MQPKRVEKALKESEEFCRTIIESSNDMIWTADMLGRFQFCNRHAEEISGYQLEEWRNKEYFPLIMKEELPNLMEIFSKVLKGQPQQYEATIKKRDGTALILSINTAPLYSKGVMIGTVSFGQEITERKMAEEKLWKSSLYTRSLIEASLDPLVTISSEGKITDVNTATELVTGVSRGRLIGSDFSDYFTEPEKAREGYRQVFETGFVKDYPLAIQHVSGNITDVLYNASVYKDSAGNVAGVFAAARDITERKRVEEERVQLLAREKTALAEAEAARNLDQLKSMFIASTSHELRTPLNSIIGFSRMLLDGFAGELNTEQKFQLDIVHSSGKHLLSLISDVIDVSKIEAGKIELQVSEVELRQVVDEVVSTLGASIKEKGLVLSVEVEKLSLKTDKRRLFQCILNLISNALKYTEKGCIKITAKTIGNRVDISVIDTGIGIKNEDIPKLFAPFARLQTPLTEKTPGTGLGLYLVKKLAKDFLGGDVGMESEFGKGSTFTLNMPIELGIIHKIN